jgi:hypothetical protein
MGTIQEELRSHIMWHMRRTRVGKRGATQAVHDGAVVRGIVPRNECWALRSFIPFQGQCGRSPLQCASFLQNSQNTSVCYPKTWTSKDETPNTSSWLPCKRSIQLNSFVNDIVNIRGIPSNPESSPRRSEHHRTHIQSLSQSRRKAATTEYPL